MSNIQHTLGRMRRGYGGYRDTKTRNVALLLHSLGGLARLSAVGMKAYENYIQEERRVKNELQLENQRKIQDAVMKFSSNMGSTAYRTKSNEELLADALRKSNVEIKNPGDLSIAMRTIQGGRQSAWTRDQRELQHQEQLFGQSSTALGAKISRSMRNLDYGDIAGKSPSEILPLLNLGNISDPRLLQFADQYIASESGKIFQRKKQEVAGRDLPPDTPEAFDGEMDEMAQNANVHEMAAGTEKEKEAARRAGAVGLVSLFVQKSKMLMDEFADASPEEKFTKLREAYLQLGTKGKHGIRAQENLTASSVGSIMDYAAQQGVASLKDFEKLDFRKIVIESPATRAGLISLFNKEGKLDLSQLSAKQREEYTTHQIAWLKNQANTEDAMGVAIAAGAGMIPKSEGREVMGPEPPRSMKHPSPNLGRQKLNVTPEMARMEEYARYLKDSISMRGETLRRKGESKKAEALLGMSEALRTGAMSPRTRKIPQRAPGIMEQLSGYGTHTTPDPNAGKHQIGSGIYPEHLFDQGVREQFMKDYFNIEGSLRQYMLESLKKEAEANQ